MNKNGSRACVGCELPQNHNIQADRYTGWLGYIIQTTQLVTINAIFQIEMTMTFPHERSYNKPTNHKYARIVYTYIFNP